MSVLRRDIRMKELEDPTSDINTDPEETLRSWGFDPDGIFTWWDDPVNRVRVITQEVKD